MRLAFFCIVPVTVFTGLCGLVLRGEDGAVFFAVFGLVVGVLATGFGAFIGRWSHRQPRS